MALIDEVNFEIFDSAAGYMWEIVEPEIIHDLKDCSELSTCEDEAIERLRECVENIFDNYDDEMRNIVLNEIDAKVKNKELCEGILSEVGVATSIRRGIVQGVNLMETDKEVLSENLARAVLREDMDGYGEGDYITSLVNYVLESDEWKKLEREKEGE